MLPQSYIQEMIDTENDLKRYIGETPMYLKRHFINYVKNGGQPASIGTVFPILRELLDQLIKDDKKGRICETNSPF